ncbi:hypothetical protein B0H13DRAFT_1884188 [Mycena leptocephala]|nr:hypothetical protein B0H13DRAFT_1884188 [Mycena leptocephala]
MYSKAMAPFLRPKLKARQNAEQAVHVTVKVVGRKQECRKDASEDSEGRESFWKLFGPMNRTNFRSRGDILCHLRELHWSVLIASSFRLLPSMAPQAVLFNEDQFSYFFLSPIPFRMAPSQKSRSQLSNNRYTPYTPLLRLPIPKGPHFSEAKKALDHFNEIGFPATWCPYSNDWIPWMLPMRVRKNTRSLVRVAACSFHKIRDLEPPNCPHIDLECKMTLHLNRVYGAHGEKGNFYRAISHACPFIVLIPDVDDHKKEYITTADEWEMFEKEDPDNVVDPSPSSSLAAEEEVEEYLLHGDPRMICPSDLPVEFSGSKPYFNERSATARKTVDLALIADVQSSYQRGTYQALPDLHPLAETPSHQVMNFYDGRTHPGNLVRAFSNLQHMDTHLGRALREFNSSIGIPQATWAAILTYNVPYGTWTLLYGTSNVGKYTQFIPKMLCDLNFQQELIPKGTTFLRPKTSSKLQQEWPSASGILALAFLWTFGLYFRQAG